MFSPEPKDVFSHEAKTRLFLSLDMKNRNLENVTQNFPLKAAGVKIIIIIFAWHLSGQLTIFFFSIIFCGRIFFIRKNTAPQPSLKS